MLETLGIARDLLIVIIGFSLVIVVHELGHFLAARWAGVRVDQFAVGFGQALVSFRKGMGFRRGSTTREYAAMHPEARAAVSETEYRLNWLPFGGYVKMLGQDDLSPGATAGAADSYSSKPVWKRMIIISAGVVMNVVLAAVLFVFVFMVGLRAPPPTVGDVAAGTPAARAEVVNAAATGVKEPGLRPGDRVVRVGSRELASFNDLALAAAMSKRDRPVDLFVEREGVAELVHLRATPEESRTTRLLQFGVGAAASPVLFGEGSLTSRERALVRSSLEAAGLGGVEPGSRLVRVNGEDVGSPRALVEAVKGTGGAPVRATFVGADGEETTVAIEPEPALASVRVVIDDDGAFRVDHLLGLTPVLRIGEPTSRGEGLGLRAGDVFARIGSVEWPSFPAGLAEIRRHAGRDLEMVVVRDGRYVTLSVSVTRGGTVGFGTSDAREVSARTSGAPDRGRVSLAEGERGDAFAAARLGLPPGSVIVEAGGEGVTDFASLRAALRAATAAAHAAGTGATVEVAYRLPLGASPDDGPVERSSWSLEAGDVAALHALGWSSPVGEWLFEPELITLRAGGPIEAVTMGVRETHRVMMMTYVTILRLFEGTVRVEHLKGPVGIAHLGTRVVDQGFVYLIFFFAIISVNLAVINFLPLPIVDGGQFVFLLIEKITGKPVSVAIQNVTAIIGLALIGSVFLIVTYNDIVAIFAG
ncbi:MAG: hypothetical protein EA379_00160 [Phycisphaerales bacterium]|nr:MAG: hypothetical protein EA379_00160 [Phycisphaerales bacterium]